MATKRKLALAALLLLIIGTPVYLQQRSIEKLRAEIALARAEALDSSLQENSRSTLGSADAAELERLRREHDELLRLRADVARLRQQLADAVPKQPARPVQPKQTEEPPEPVQIFVANADATVPAGQTLAFGGWATPPGKRTLVFVYPTIAEPGGAGRLGSILLESRFLEIPEEALAKVASDLNIGGLDRLRADGKASSVQTLFTADESALILKTLESTEGVDLLSAPRVQTGEGGQAVVSVTEKKEIAGREHILGPSLDVEPRLAADGSSVNLTVSARIRKASAPQANTP